jgi:hypothetical protein
MPEICRFFGVIIRMFVDEHGTPHFHAFYQDHKISIAIETGAVLAGKLPPRVLGFVQEWRALHQEELMSNWNHAMTDGKFTKIKPLE